MLKKEFYISIETSLVSLGSYAYGQYTPEDLDFQIDIVLNGLINSLIPSSEDSQLKLDLLRTLKKKDKLTLLGEVLNDIYTYSLPTEYRNKLSVITHTIVEGKEESISTANKNKINLGNYYEILSEKVRLNSEWYDKGQLLYINDTVVDFYGTIKQTINLVGDVRVVSSENIQNLRFSIYNKPTLYSPLGEIENNKVVVYLPKCTPLKIETFLTYYKKPKTFNSYSLEEELELPETFLTLLVGEVIKQLQNNLNN
jgi:hypothetical protein